MEIAAGASPPPPAAGPIIGGRPVQWTLRDVGIGLLLFIGLLVGSLVATAPFIGFGENSTEFYAASLAGSALWEVSLVLVAVRLTWGKYGGGWERLGIGRPGWATLGWAAVAFAATLAFALGYDAVINAFDFGALKSECDDQLPKELLDNRTALILASIFAIGFAPVCEEIFFRGFAFTGIWRAWGLAAGIVASAALFSVVHVGPSMHKTIIPILVIGAIFAATYWRSGSLLSTMGAHLANNVLAVIGLWTVDTMDC